MGDEGELVNLTRSGQRLGFRFVFRYMRLAICTPAYD